MLGELDALGGNLVYMGGLDPFLAVTPELGIPQVIGQDENDVWLVNSRADWSGNAKQESGQYGLHWV